MKEISLEIQCLWIFTGHIFFFEPPILVEIQLSNEKNWLHRQGNILPSYVGIAIINHYKDAYETTDITESKMSFLCDSIVWRFVYPKDSS